MFVLRGMAIHSAAVALLIVVAPPFASVARGELSYYATSDTAFEGFLHHIDSNGNATLITSGPSAGRPMFPAVHEDRLYWSTYYPGKIYESGLMGEGAVMRVDQGNTVTRAIEFYGNEIYWANEVHGKIYKSDFAFQNIDTVVSGHLGYDNGIWDFAIDGNRFYWTSWDSSSVKSTKLDGSDFQVINVPTVFRAFALEAYNGRLYLSDNRSNGTGRIVSVNTSGGDLKILVDGPYALSLDVHGDRLYYNDERGSSISSVPLAGGDWRVEVPTPRSSWQITVVPEPSTLVLSIVGAGTLSCVIRRRRLTQARSRQSA